MISIRNSFFETNSSSCHVFIYNKKAEVSVPKVVELHPDSKDSMLDILFNDYYRWYSPGKFGEDYMSAFIDNLYNIGIKTIKCNFDKDLKKLIAERKDCYMDSYHTNDKEALRKVLFNNDTKIATIEDYMDFDEIVRKKYGKEYSYISLRLS